MLRFHNTDWSFKFSDKNIPLVAYNLSNLQTNNVPAWTGHGHTISDKTWRFFKFFTCMHKETTEKQVESKETIGTWWDMVSIDEMNRGFHVSILWARKLKNMIIMAAFLNSLCSSELSSWLAQSINPGTFNTNEECGRGWWWRIGRSTCLWRSLLWVLVWNINSLQNREIKLEYLCGKYVINQTEVLYNWIVFASNLSYWYSVGLTWDDIIQNCQSFQNKLKFQISN